MKFTLVIVRPPGYRFSDCFREVSETVMHGLRALGHEAETTENKFRHNTKHIIFGGHLLSPDSVLPPDSIIYNLEQVAGGNIGHLLILGGKYTLWDYAKPNCDEWAKRRIQAMHVPVGYVPEMTHIQPAEEDIDVLFYGSMNKRRADILDQLYMRGLNVEARVNDAYGPYLDSLIARAKVILNVHYYESRIFEIVRVGYALANKKAVVSEQSIDDYANLKDGIRIVSYASLVDACRDLIGDESAREELASKGLKSFSSAPESEFLEDALDLVTA